MKRENAGDNKPTEPINPNESANPEPKPEPPKAAKRGEDVLSLLRDSFEIKR